MKKYFWLLILLGLTLGARGSPSAAWAQVERNPFCPVMQGERVKDRFYIDYEGRRIHFCCKSCVKRFKKHPEKYLKNLE